MRDKSGVTLIELLIVIVVIGIIAAIAIPGYIGQQRRAARQEAFSNLTNLRLLQEQFFADNGRYACIAGGMACGPDMPGNVAIIQNAGGDTTNDLPGFNPGGGLNFSYCIVLNQTIAGAAQTPCFRAEAHGNTNSRVPGEVYMIDCNNDRDF